MNYIKNDVGRRAKLSSRTFIAMPCFMALGAALAAPILAGCSSVVSNPVPAGSNKPVAVDGLIYRLPEGLIHVTGNFSKAPDATTYTVTASATIQPDPAAGEYVARRNADYFSDDSFRAEISTTNGLLTSGAATNNDELPQIIAAVAQAVGPLAAPGPADTNAPTPFDYVFDPANEGSYAQTQTNITQACGLNMTISPAPGDSKEVAVPDNPIEEETKGLLYRPLKIYTVHFEGRIRTGSSIVLDQNVLLPDKSVIYYVPFERMAFSDKVTAVTFLNGVPVSFSESVPSPVLGFVGIPKSIISSILPVPTTSTAAQGVAKSK